MSDKHKVGIDSIVSLEQPFVKVPIEQYRKSFRQVQKLIEREISSNILNQINDLMKNITKENSEAIIQRLTQLKKKLEVSTKEAKAFLERACLRINHLNELSKFTGTDDPKFESWNNVMLERLLVDYMLREGHTETAKLIAAKPELSNFVDTELFTYCRKIELALKGKNCSEALQWCTENKSNLKKSKSPLEFNLRVQEFTELVRQNKMKEAIQYAKKNFAPWAETNLPQIQKAMALIAFPPPTTCARYRDMYSEKCWDNLIAQFKFEIYQLHNLTAQPMICLKLQAGLSALKTPLCFREETKNINCPVCSNILGELAKKLPYSHHINSCLVCLISGDIMNEDNPPWMLPNGYVYSEKALKQMADKEGGYVTCPRTKEVYPFSDLRKCFIS